MDANEITFEDLLTEEPSGASAATSYERLLAEGFPRKGGLADLANIAQMADSGSRFAALRKGYLEILELQSRAQAMRP